MNSKKTFNLLKVLETHNSKNNSIHFDVRFLEYFLCHDKSEISYQKFLEQYEVIKEEKVKQRKANKKRHDAFIVFLNELFLVAKTLKPIIKTILTTSTPAYQTPPSKLFTQVIANYTHTLSRP